MMSESWSLGLRDLGGGRRISSVGRLRSAIIRFLVVSRSQVLDSGGLVVVTRNLTGRL
jgi:hypothetical protein